MATLTFIYPYLPSHLHVTTAIDFSRNYTKLAMLSFLYCFVVKGKLISAKSFPPVGFKPATQHLSIFIPISCKIESLEIP